MEKYDEQLSHFTNLIRNKYGDLAVIDFSLLWTPIKEKMYREFLKQEFYQEQEHSKRKHLIKNRFNTCEVCNNITNKPEDQSVMTRYNTCFKCYIQYIADGREKRWLNGWRPQNNNG